MFIISCSLVCGIYRFDRNMTNSEFLLESCFPIVTESSKRVKPIGNAKSQTKLVTAEQQGKSKFWAVEEANLQSSQSTNQSVLQRIQKMTEIIEV